MTETNTKQDRLKTEIAPVAQLSISTVGMESRIAAIADAVGGNSALARLADVSESVVRKWTAGASEPTASNLVAVARVGKVTVEWLATGVLPKEPANAANIEGCVSVPLYEIKRQGGQDAFAAGDPSAQKIIVPRDWLIEHVIGSQSLAFIHMHGDAMRPTLHNDDLLLIDRSDTLVAKGIYVFFMSGFLFIQRLERTTAGVLTIIEEDPQRTPGMLPDLSELSKRSGVYGRVVWVGRKL